MIVRKRARLLTKMVLSPFVNFVCFVGIPA
jgi:hypothetical protein